MKKTILFRITALIAAIAMTISSFGQYSGLTMNVSRNRSNDSEKNADIKPDAKTTSLEELKQINVKIYNDFARSSKHADSIRVSQSGKEVFVTYDMDDAHHRICYNLKGNRNYHIQYYAIEKIPADVLDLVKTEYPFFNVLRGAQVEVGDKTAYMVDIDNKKAFKTIRVIDGNFDEYSSNKK